jgi:6-phosphogluconolactonase
MRRVTAGGGETMHAPNEFLIYVGTAIYTGPPSKNIYAYRFDAQTGKTIALGVVAESINPGTVGIEPSGRFLYATNEVGNFKDYPEGGVSAFSIDRATGKLHFLNDQFSGGVNPAHINVDATSKYVVVANYFGGKVVVFPIHSDGRLGSPTASEQRDGSSVNKQRQEGPHPHSVNFSPDNRYVLACDLGLDKVLVYQFDSSKGSLRPNDPPFASVNPGAGPRHLAFAPSGRFAYVVNELQSSITVFSYDAACGALNSRQTISSLPADFHGENSGAEIAIAPSGRFLYVSNRGLNSVAFFAIDGKNGDLTLLGNVMTLGKTPRSFAIDPSGRYLFVGNEESDNIRIFQLDSQTGRLHTTDEVLRVKAPTCITFVPLE